MKKRGESDEEEKKIIVNFRMTPEEKKKLLAKAEEAHMSLSGYIIALSKSKRVVLKDEIAELTVEISRIGNNINQIAHTINQIAHTGNSQKFLYKAQLNDVVKHLQAIEDLQRKILMAMFSDEEHTIITVEKKIDRLTERMENLTERMNGIGSS